MAALAHRSTAARPRPWRSLHGPDGIGLLHPANVELDNVTQVIAGCAAGTPASKVCRSRTALTSRAATSGITISVTVDHSAACELGTSSIASSRPTSSGPSALRSIELAVAVLAQEDRSREQPPAEQAAFHKLKHQLVPWAGRTHIVLDDDVCGEVPSVTSS